MALSYYEYTADGVQTQYTSPPYLDPSHIQVSVGDTVIASSYYTLTVTSLTFNTPPVSGTVIRIARKTSQNLRLTNYEDASLLTADVMDDDANQLFFMAQEAIDTASETNVGVQTFYNASATAPVAPVIGDLWYDAANKYLKIYNGSQWDLATPSNETYTFDNSSFVAEGVNYHYINVANLTQDAFVFLNGVKLVEGSTQTSVARAVDPTDYYLDLANNRVYFAPLAAADVVEIVIAPADLGTNNNTQLETFTATAGQTVFDLTKSYIPATNTLHVYVNGVRQSAYTETNATTVTFTNGLSVGDEVTFITNQYQVSQGFTAAENVTYTPVGSSTATTVKNLLDNTALNPNLLINGGFDIWQRGTSFPISNVSDIKYTTDRWRSLLTINGGSGGITSHQQTFSFGQTDVPNNPRYYTTITGNNVTTGTDGRVSLDQLIRILPNGEVTVSFYAKTDNPTGRTIAVGFNTITDVANSVQHYGVAQTVTLTNNWQLFTLTFNLPDVSGEALGANHYTALMMRLVNKGSHTTQLGLSQDIPDLGNDSVSIAQVKLEEGSNFTGWPHVDPATELAKCQRYYFKQNVRVPTVYDAGLSLNRSIVVFPVTMRAHAHFSILSYTAQGHNTNNTQPVVYANDVYGGIDIGATDQAYRQYGHHTLVTVTADAEL